MPLRQGQVKGISNELGTTAASTAPCGNALLGTLQCTWQINCSHQRLTPLNASNDKTAQPSCCFPGKLRLMAKWQSCFFGEAES